MLDPNVVETISRDAIDQTKVSEEVFMPEGLLDGLDQRETIELLKHLMHARQE